MWKVAAFLLCSMCIINVGYAMHDDEQHKLGIEVVLRHRFLHEICDEKSCSLCEIKESLKKSLDDNNKQLTVAVADDELKNTTIHVEDYFNEEYLNSLE